MDKELLYNSLLKWLQAFNVETSSTSVEDVSDGVAMAQALAVIAPEWFNDSFLKKIRTDTANNWRLKVSNLKKVLDSIVDYYHEVLGQNITSFSLPDVVKIGEHHDTAELGRFLQLILICAVNCENKQEHIKMIMGMEESLQQVIMRAIQELMTRELSGSQESLGSLPVIPGIGPRTPPPGVDHQMRQLLTELEAAQEGRERMLLRVQELDTQVSLLQEEKACLAVENERLNNQMKTIEATEDAPAQIQRLRKQLDQLREENDKLDQAREEYRIRVELLEQNYNEARAQADTVSSANEVNRRLQDEIDALREVVAQAQHHEQAIQTYKKKLEEQGDMKRQMRILEDKNVDYMRQNMLLEEELQKALMWKPQAESFKKQLGDLRAQLSEETRRADRAEIEAKRYQEKLSALLREKEVLIGERDTLKEGYEELKCSALQPGVSSPCPSDLADTDALEMLPLAVREKLARLQLENKTLREKDSTETVVLRVQLEQLQEREKQLTTENRCENITKDDSDFYEGFSSTNTDTNLYPAIYTPKASVEPEKGKSKLSYISTVATVHHRSPEDNPASLEREILCSKSAEAEDLYTSLDSDNSLVLEAVRVDSPTRSEVLMGPDEGPTPTRKAGVIGSCTMQFKRKSGTSNWEVDKDSVDMALVDRRSPRICDDLAVGTRQTRSLGREMSTVKRSKSLRSEPPKISYAPSSVGSDGATPKVRSASVGAPTPLHLRRKGRGTPPRSIDPYTSVSRTSSEFDESDSSYYQTMDDFVKKKKKKSRKSAIVDALNSVLELCAP